MILAPRLTYTDVLEKIAKSGCECGAHASSIAAAGLEAMRQQSDLRPKYSFQVFEYPSVLHYGQIKTDDLDVIQAEFSRLKEVWAAIPKTTKERRVVRVDGPGDYKVFEEICGTPKSP